MSSLNFGTIFNFAEKLEKQDMDFYTAAAANPACAPHRELLESLSKNCKKNVQGAQRARRECVTEMILEPIRDLSLTDFQEPVEDPTAMDAVAVLAKANRLENRAEEFYLTASSKIKALAEVAQVLKTSAKIRRRNRNALDAL